MLDNLSVFRPWRIYRKLLNLLFMTCSICDNTIGDVQAAHCSTRIGLNSAGVYGSAVTRGYRTKQTAVMRYSDMHSLLTGLKAYIYL